jgi:hypothetical protein
MLNLNRQEQALTQGQSQGKRVVARAVQVDELEVQPDQQADTPRAGAALPGGMGSAGVADAQAVAQRVYELMRQDLRVELERRKPGR